MAQDVVDDLPGQALPFTGRERNLFLIDDALQFVLDILVELGLLQ